MPSCDAIIIGAGVNGLACARRLAGKGLRVVVVEAGAVPGGGAGSVEFHPGFTAPALAHLTQGLDPRLASVAPVAFHPPLATAVIGTAGPLVVEGAQAGGPDSVTWAALHTRLAGFAQALAPFRRMPPPRLAKGNDWAPMMRPLWGMRGLGREELRELMRMILINVHDVGEDELTDDRLRGLLSFDATLGAWLGPRSPNSLILYLDRLARGPAPLLPKGGMGALVTSLAQGLDIRCGARVEKVLIAGDRAVGVRLVSGEDLNAPRVISAINPRTTFHTLVGARELDAGFYTSIGHIRLRGGAAKLHLALDGLPDFGVDPKARIVLAPSSNAVEDAFTPVKYGEVPARPVMEIILPSAHEPGIAPEGAHVLSAIVQFAPHAPKAGLEAARAQILENALRVLEQAAPGLRARVRHAELLMPQDIEARFGMPGGNWHHGELAVEQMLFNRPLHSTDRYATPLPGLWLAGAGAHPGGGIEGAAGWNAAERILAEGRA
ncbi:MAG: phytoene desaturase family protein [Pararhodobacter sp.]